VTPRFVSFRRPFWLKRFVVASGPVPPQTRGTECRARDTSMMGIRIPSSREKTYTLEMRPKPKAMIPLSFNTSPFKLPKRVEVQ